MPSEFADLYSKKRAHNVSRADDPPTLGLRLFATTAIRGPPDPRRAKALLILSFAGVRTLSWCKRRASANRNFVEGYEDNTSYVFEDKDETQRGVGLATKHTPCGNACWQDIPLLLLTYKR